jgi:hypothetical protein
MSALAAKDGVEQWVVIHLELASWRWDRAAVRHVGQKVR